jgi:hypothetical protein
MELPDVVGNTYEQAVKILNSAGYCDIKAVMTSPPKRAMNVTVANGDRVLRIKKLNNNTVELIVCRIKKLEEDPSQTEGSVL